MNGIILHLTRRALSDLAEGGLIMLTARNVARNERHPLCCILSSDNLSQEVLQQLDKGYGDRPGLGLTVGQHHRQRLYDQGWTFIDPLDTWPFGDGSYRNDQPVGLCVANSGKEVSVIMKELGIRADVLQPPANVGPL